MFRRSYYSIYIREDAPVRNLAYPHFLGRLPRIEVSTLLPSIWAGRFLLQFFETFHRLHLGSIILFLPSMVGRLAHFELTAHFADFKGCGIKLNNPWAFGSDDCELPG